MRPRFLFLVQLVRRRARRFGPTADSSPATMYTYPSMGKSSPRRSRRRARSGPPCRCGAPAPAHRSLAGRLAGLRLELLSNPLAAPIGSDPPRTSTARRPALAAAPSRTGLVLFQLVPSSSCAVLFAFALPRPRTRRLAPLDFQPDHVVPRRSSSRPRRPQGVLARAGKLPAARDGERYVLSLTRGIRPSVKAKADS
mgnify:CR=1 FL=1